jgi:glucose/mannose-6-phosphate isomerase
MYEKILKDFPNQFERSLDLAKNARVKFKNFENIIILGIGGSAWSGDLVDIYLTTELKIPIYINRDYTLPKYTTSNSLVIVIAYSGNTEEPLSAYKEALQKKMTIFAITSGGILKELCEKNHTPIVLIPSGIPPRCATGYIFTSILVLLSNLNLISSKEKDIKQTANALKTLKLEAKAMEIAKKLVNKIPIIYASDRFKAISRIWKIKLNETSKVMAFHNYLPELNHNELMGYTYSKLQGKFHVIIIRDKEDHPRVKKRMELTAELIKSMGIEVTMIDTIEGSLLTRIFGTLLLGDWISYYLALEYGADPIETKLQEDFKKAMSKFS